MMPVYHEAFAVVTTIGRPERVGQPEAYVILLLSSFMHVCERICSGSSTSISETQSWLLLCSHASCSLIAHGTRSQRAATQPERTGMAVHLQ